ncbi:voltage-gated potassium channel [Lachnospiraceae bacterium XBB1006]|nr:voltage-gated potassium channel [Lachnospiraceae bacterium XBB1006]
MKKKIFDIIQIGDKSNVASRVFDLCLVAVILLNIGTMVLETFSSLAAFHTTFWWIENLTTAFFCIEYVLRIWTADLLYPERGQIRARLRFLVSYDGIVDLLTILPWFFLSGFVVFRMLRVVRILHLFRINAQYDSFNVITSVLLERRNQIMSSIFIILVLMLASSLCMYSAEHEVQPKAFSNALSGIWWTTSAILTVGYGDIYPVTMLGKAMAVLISFLGVGVVAIPTGIISAGFVEQYAKDARENKQFKREDLSEMGEILVGKEHDYCSRTIEEIEANYSIRIYLVLRGSLHIMPTADLVIEEGDIIVQSCD